MAPVRLVAVGHTTEQVLKSHCLVDHLPAWYGLAEVLQGQHDAIKHLEQIPLRTPD